MTQLGIVYFIGAGASQAIDQAHIPGMDLFPAMRDYFGGEWDELRRRLSRAGFMDAPVEDPRKKNTVFLAWPGPSMVDGIEQLLQALAERTTSRIANEAQAAQDAHDLIKVFINRFFVHLDIDFVGKAGETPYALLAKAVRTRGRGHRHVFVSFNYDLWLERSLQAEGLWNSANGYLENNVNPIDLKFVGPNKTPQKLPTTEPSPTMIYKPHGSLSFLVPQRNPYRIPVLHLDDDGILDGKWAKGKVEYLAAGQDSLEVNTPGEASQALVPLVVPPAQDKGITGDFLFKINKGIERALEGCHVIVVIGWSMPLTDSFIRQRIFDALNKRHDANNVKLLMLCDVNQTDLFYDRFRAVMPASSNKVFKGGFSLDFIETKLLPLWAGGLT